MVLTSEIDTLLKRIQNGEHIVLERLIMLKTGRVFAVAMCYLKDRMLAEDAVNEVFYKLSKNCYRLNSETELNKWLKTVTINNCIDKLRRKKDELPLLDDRLYAAADILEKTHVKECWFGLNANERKALAYNTHGYTLKETAVLMSMTFSEVRRFLEKARAKYIKIFDACEYKTTR